MPQNDFSAWNICLFLSEDLIIRRSSFLSLHPINEKLQTIITEFSFDPVFYIHHDN